MLPSSSLVPAFWPILVPFQALLFAARVLYLSFDPGPVIPEVDFLIPTRTLPLLPTPCALGFLASNALHTAEWVFAYGSPFLPRLRYVAIFTLSHGLWMLAASLRLRTLRRWGFTILVLVIPFIGLSLHLQEARCAGYLLAYVILRRSGIELDTQSRLYPFLVQYTDPGTIMLVFGPGITRILLYALYLPTVAVNIITSGTRVGILLWVVDGQQALIIILSAFALAICTAMSCVITGILLYVVGRCCLWLVWLLILELAFPIGLTEDHFITDVDVWISHHFRAMPRSCALIRAALIHELTTRSNTFWLYVALAAVPPITLFVCYEAVTFSSQTTDRPALTILPETPDSQLPSRIAPLPTDPGRTSTASCGAPNITNYQHRDETATRARIAIRLLVTSLGPNLTNERR
ncbi:hypothetical protein HMN09_00324800 [Mycena chlorophos]|uniref:Uncharacterized protein n=1 Tax=Mycena chlorophos TaxID=658473 RepID=A0A8H6WII3_MYCCL|nr:hypothetical protein HMN09_00324800 [Mycena chlorophos]